MPKSKFRRNPCENQNVNKEKCRSIRVVDWVPITFFLGTWIWSKVIERKCAMQLLERKG